jgi:multiple sugar transport system permease protein
MIKTNGKFSTTDFITPVSVIVIWIAFLLLPWFDEETYTTGLWSLSKTWSFEPWFIKSWSWEWLILVSALIGTVASLWGLLSTSSMSKWTAFMAGMVGVMYYENSLLTGTMDMANLGFWVGLVAVIGLTVQILIPRSMSTIDLPARMSRFNFAPTMKTKEIIAAYIFLAPFLIFFSIFFVRAALSSVNISLYDWRLLRPTKPWVGLDNYKDLLSDEIWWTSVRQTAYFTAMTVAGTTIVGLAAALAVTRPIRGQGFYRVLFYVPQLMSVGAIGLIWNWLLSGQFGVINYVLNLVFGIHPINWLGDPDLVLPALSMATIWWTFGFPMLIFIAGLQGIPEHLYEAARIDGANPRQIFFRITLPLLRPTILFVTVTGVIGHFQVFGQPYIMSGGGGPGRASYTVIIYLYQQAWVAFRMGYGAAVAVAIAVIMATITAVQFLVISRRVEY